MLICSNDGFAALSRARPLWRVQRVYPLYAHDAGTEENSERSADIVDPCSALGPMPLAGDPNGNEDATVDTDPLSRIWLHRVVRGVGDLSIDAHGWQGFTGVAIVKRID